MRIMERMLRQGIALAMLTVLACGGGEATSPSGVASVEVTAPRTSLVAGDSLTLSVSVRDAQGRAITGKVATWSTSDAGVATVSSAGRVLAVALGTVTISATVEGRSGSLVLTVGNLAVEAGRRVSVAVGLEGDTITVTNSAGTTFSLEIPAGALEAPVTISMTPVTGLAGATVFTGGLLGGVQFEPSGLRFLRPVRLRISGFAPPTGGVIPVGFIARDDGTLESLTPAAAGNGVLTLVVPHFSIQGGASTAPASLQGILTCPAPCGGTGLFLNNLSILLAQGGSRADIVQLLAFWGSSLEATVLIPALNGTSELLHAISEYALWMSTIEFVANLRPDLASIVGDEPLNTAMNDNIERMGEALLAGIDRNARACRDNQSLSEAELVLYWQEQAAALDLETLDLIPFEGRGDLERQVVLEYLRQQCFTVVSDTAILAEPLVIGQSRDLTTSFKVKFRLAPTPQGAPFRMKLVPQDALLSVAEGFTDAAGQFNSAVIPVPSARSTGVTMVTASACLVLPTQAALGAQAKASDICEFTIVERTVELYFNDFSSTAGSEWTVNTISTSPSGERFLGEMGNQSVALFLDSLPDHDTLVVDVDLYMIDSWNGNAGTGASAAADVITIELQTGGMILQTTFSNKVNDLQSFPASWPNGSFPRGTGARAIESLGYPPGPDYFGDSIYRLQLRFPHTGAFLPLIFRSGQTAGPGGERWGIDNVRVTIAR